MPDDAKAKIDEALKTGEVDPDDIPESAKKAPTDDEAADENGDGEEKPVKKTAAKVCSTRCSSPLTLPGDEEARQEGRGR